MELKRNTVTSSKQKAPKSFKSERKAKRTLGPRKGQIVNKIIKKQRFVKQIRYDRSSR